MRVHFLYLHNLSIFKFRITIFSPLFIFFRMRMSAIFNTTCLSILFFHIRHIIFLRTQKRWSGLHIFYYRTYEVQAILLVFPQNV